MGTEWTWIMAVLGLTSTWLTGKSSTAALGWVVTAVSQVVWIAYITSTEQWGLLIGAILHSGIVGRNVHLHLRLRREERRRGEEVTGEPGRRDPVRGTR